MVGVVTKDDGGCVMCEGEVVTYKTHPNIIKIIEVCMREREERGEREREREREEGRSILCVYTLSIDWVYMQQCHH